ncbi:hypothetical protein, partial [Aeromonas schubertii]
ENLPPNQMPPKTPRNAQSCGSTLHRFALKVYDGFTGIQRVQPRRSSFGSIWLGREDFARFAEVQDLLQMVKTDTCPISSGGAIGPTHLIASTNTATASAAAATESTATENPRFSVNELVESVFKIFSI